MLQNLPNFARAPQVFKTLPFMLRRLKIWWYSTHAVTQQQLNDAYTGPEFKLSGNIADVLVLVMVAVVYGSSMPVLYFIATFGCWVCLKLDRRLLLRQGERGDASLCISIYR